MTTPREKILLVIGAGASHDVWGGIGTPEIDWRPPLTRGIFGTPETIDDLPNQTFQNILSTYPGAERIAASLVLPHSHGIIEFEKELGRYATNPDTKGDFMHVPPYIRDVIGGPRYATSTDPEITIP